MQKAEAPEQPSRPAYFWWLLANGLALSFAVLSWAVCLHVFGNPEVPRNYRILEKIGRLPDPVTFPHSKVPDTVVFDIKRQYSQFIGLDEAKLRELNQSLMRNYLKNLDESSLVHYVEGIYRIAQVRPLTADDVVSEGFVVRARALIKPDDFSPPSPYPVLIDLIFSTNDVSASSDFRENQELSISRIPDSAIILHVSKLVIDDEMVVCLTVMPISHGTNHRHNDHGFQTKAPDRINPGAKLPLFNPIGS